MTLAERVKKCREDLGLSQAELAARAKVSAGTIGNIESGVRKQPRELLAIAEALTVLPKWLQEGTGPKRESAALPARKMGALAADSEEPSPGQGYPVPVLSTKASMGPGVEMHDDIVVGRLVLSPQWISTTLRARPEAVRFIHGYGDSMEPTFKDGDVLLVDTDKIDAQNVDGIYVLEANDRLYVKRVRHTINGELQISSDNPTVKTVDVLNGNQEVTVKGKVVWLWNGRKL